MKKLKDILLEGYAWERRPGQPLPTLAEVQAEYQRNEASKPDFLDLDKDGDTEEPMKDAAKDINEEDAPRWQDSDGDGKWYEPGDDVKEGLDEASSFQERFAEYSDDALRDMIVTLRRFDGTKDDVQELEQELDRRKQDKDSVNEYGDDETHSISTADTGVEPYDAAYDKPKDAMMESFWKRVNGNLHGHEYILREAFRK